MKFDVEKRKSMKHRRHSEKKSASNATTKGNAVTPKGHTAGKRGSMAEKIIDEMRVPHGEEYSTAVDTNIRRRTICELNDKEISLQRSYTIDGRQFIVNSVFDKAVKKTAADGVIRLIDIELEKVS